MVAGKPATIRRARGSAPRLAYKIMNSGIQISYAIAGAALIISIIALVYTVRAFLLKSGLSVRGTYGITSSISCEERYVSHVTIENMKDRAVVIFKIYLKLGSSYYIEIENFEENPLILNAFEVFHREYDPIVYYAFNTKRLIMDDLLKDDKIKKRIVLKTTEGKYNVKQIRFLWDPTVDYFKNYFTAVPHPMRTRFKDKGYGGNVKFLVQIHSESGKNLVVPIHERDHERKVFNEFCLTKEAIESTDALETFLNQKKNEGSFPVESFELHNLEEWRRKNYKLLAKEVIHAKAVSPFKYYILGRIYTKMSQYKMKSKNRNRQKANKSL